MSRFIVTGGKPLGGVFTPTGNKNESLPVLAAALLTDEEVKLENIPLIGDFLVLRRITEELGVKLCAKGEKTLAVEAGEIRDQPLNTELCTQIRGSFLLAVPLLRRFGKVSVPVPGGDTIGRRRLDTHLLALGELGVEIEKKTGGYTLRARRFVGNDILLDEASVMATENAVMAASLAEGTTRIYNAACEPHVQGLCRMLVKMGAQIQGLGSNLLTVEGVSSLKGCSHRIAADHTEIGSMIGLAAITRSQLIIEDCAGLDLGLIPLFFGKLGIRFEREGDRIVVPDNQSMEIVRDDDASLPKIDDGPWPSFPADLTSIMTVVATQCRGNALIFEKMFESRLFWVDKLISMGAGIVLCDPHRAVVYGPSKLYARELTSPDIRAGMAILLAAMCAEGTSSISNIGQIDRGYEKIDERLNALGAQIQRV